MLKRHRFKFILFYILCFVLNIKTNSCLAQTPADAFSPISPIKVISTSNSNQIQNELTIELNQNSQNSKTIDLKDNDSFYYFTNATDKFIQCNIRASWADFKSAIIDFQDNDFMYASLANKMADLGLFDLANLAVSKIKDKDIYGISTDAMKRFYYPKRKLKLENELLLAEIYSNILYNNQSSEATAELLKNEAILSNSDYANYLVALGSYKSNNFKQAAKYINIALLQNPSTLNYQKLKAEILAEEDEPAEAIKIVENLKKQNLYSLEYETKIKSLEQFILYKTKKSEWEKNYHLGYYCYLENDNSKAIRTLQNALAAKKHGDVGAIYALMSEIYLKMNEFEKAADTAKKAYRISRNNPLALMTLGDLSCRDKDFRQALIYYKKAASLDKKAYKPLVKEAEAYQKLSNIKKAMEIYEKVLKTHSDSWEAYYNVALLEKDTSSENKKNIYLKKALAVNPLFEAAWIELAKMDIDKGNYDIAQKYLSNALYIDENDFKYYYYQGLINNNTGNFTQAKYNFKKCLKLNPTCKEALTALDSILNSENNSQDNI